MIQTCKARMAAHYGLDPALFDAGEHQYVPGDTLRLISFGRAVVFSGPEADLAWCRERLGSLDTPFILDLTALFPLNQRLRETGRRLSGEHLRFLRLRPELMPPPPAGFEIKLYEKDELTALYGGPKWSNAFNYKDDVIAAAAFAPGGMDPVSVAGADDKIPGMWQIGIDTLPQYRGRGLAPVLVAMLADAISQKGALPFYTTWSGNLASVHTALKSGFVPVWTEYFAEELKEEQA